MQKQTIQFVVVVVVVVVIIAAVVVDNDDFDLHYDYSIYYHCFSFLLFICSMGLSHGLLIMKIIYFFQFGEEFNAADGSLKVFPRALY